MRYIRTKNKIYDTYSSGIILSKNKTTHELEFFYQSYAFSIPFQLEVLSQADTIEELGDVYVIVPKDSKSKPYTVNTLSGFDDVTDVLRDSDIYLSIWVGADLHSVAKMNDKGELELL